MSGHSGRECHTTYYVERNVGGQWMTVSLRFPNNDKARDYARKLLALYPNPLRVVREHVCRKRDVLDETKSIGVES